MPMEKEYSKTVPWTFLLLKYVFSQWRHNTIVPGNEIYIYICQKRIHWRQEILCQWFAARLWFICSSWVAQWDHNYIWESGTIFPWGVSITEVAELLYILYIPWSIIAPENKTIPYAMMFCLFVDIYRHCLYLLYIYFLSKLSDISLHFYTNYAF